MTLPKHLATGNSDRPQLNLDRSTVSIKNSPILSKVEEIKGDKAETEKEDEES